MLPETAAVPLTFGRFEIRPAERRLLIDGAPAELGARAFDLLLALAERRDRLVAKQELLDVVWPGVVVEEGNIATQISALRKLLGGGVIATLPGRGYRFTASPAGELTSRGTLDTPALATPIAEPARLRTNLPAELTALLGRADDMAALGELVDRHRLVTIVGAGGMGKTLLAQHLLALRRDAYRHGVCWVALAQITSADALPPAIAAALGVQPGAGEPLAGLCGVVAPLTLLVVLDNAEQVVDGVARVAEALLDAAPGLRLVVTSQAPLKLAAERVYRIGPLAVPQGALPAAQARDFGAVALFVERAQAADARFVLTDAHAPTVIDICRQLDGLALAIELAAARAPMLGMQRLRDSMQDRLKLLIAGRNRSAPQRQQTLRATLEWSHGFLDQRERAVFRRMAVFAGSTSLTLVQQVVADPPGEGDVDEWAVLDALSVLVDRSLVALVTAGEAEPRYRLLESPKLYALERLCEAGEHEALRRRHALAVGALFDANLDAPYRGDIGLDAWQAAMAAELDNGREALAWAQAADEPTLILQIAVTMLDAVSLSLPAERLALFEVCEPLIDRGDRVELQVHACLRLSMSHTRHGLRAFALAQRALHKTRSVPATDTERWLRYRVLCRLAPYSSGVRDSRAAREALAEARDIENPGWPPHRRRFLMESQSLALAHDDAAESLRLLRELLPMEVSAGRREHITGANLIDAELAAGDALAASQTGVALLAMLEGTRDERSLLFARVNTGAAWLALGRTAHARELLETGWAKARAFKAQHVFADHLSLLAALEDRCEAAARLIGYADACNEPAGPRDPNEAAAIERARMLVRVALGDGEYDRLSAEGRLLCDEQIDAIAFAMRDAT